MSCLIYTPTWVVMTDAWSVIGPFASEASAIDHAEAFGGEVVAMISPSDWKEGRLRLFSEQDEKDEWT